MTAQEIARMINHNSDQQITGVEVYHVASGMDLTAKRYRGSRAKLYPLGSISEILLAFGVTLPTLG